MTRLDKIAIAFDLDDTLYGERDYVEACIGHVARSLAPVLGEDPGVLRADMLSCANPYDGLCAGVAGNRIEIGMFLDIYRSTRPDTLPMYPDARRLLEALRARRPDIPLYLITDGRFTGQMAKIDALGLDEYFAPGHILISETTGYDKHSSMPFVTVMARERRDSGWIYFGDNPAKDFGWPRRLGWEAVMLRDRGRNIHPQPPLETLAETDRPTRVIDTFDTVIAEICPG